MICTATEKPTIIQGPKLVTVGFQNIERNPPTFTCTVGGAPRPSLIWSYIPSHNIGIERALLLSNGTDYRMTYNETVAANGLSLVTSTVVFLSTTNTDGGIIRCQAGKTADAFADALLTVLGMYVYNLLLLHD